MIPGVVASAANPDSGLQYIGHMWSTAWDSAAGTVTLDVATGIPSATTGDLLVLVAGYGGSGSLPPSSGTTPSGWTAVGWQRSSGASVNDYAAVGVYTRSYASSVVAQKYANVNRSVCIIAFRGHAASSPVAASFADNFSSSNSYPGVAQPTGKSSIGLTSQVHASGSSMSASAFPAPGNYPSATRVTGASDYWVVNSLFRTAQFTAVDNASGGTFTPGTVGGGNDWSAVVTVVVTGAT